MKFNVFCQLVITCFLSLVLFANSSTSYATADVWDVLRGEFTLNHEVNRPEVQEQIRWLRAHPSYLQKVCHQSEPYIYHILGEIRKRKLPGELALLPMIESAYDPFAYSGAGAAGLWQLMPRTGSELGLKQDWWFDGRRSIRPSTDAALNHLVYLNRLFNGNWIFAIAAYDAGEGTLAKAIKTIQDARQTLWFWNLPLPNETRIYVPRLLALSELIENSKAYKVVLPGIPYLPYFEEVNIGSQIDLNHAARLAGISYKELIKLNPGFNRWTTAPYEPFRLLIPAENVERFNQNLAHVPEEKRVSWIKHQVKSGDNLANIATRYHTTINLIRQLNQLKSNNLVLNQSLLIPSSVNAPATAIALHPTAPTEPALAAPRTIRIIHIVQQNDSWKKIEKIYGINRNIIQAWNSLSDTSTPGKGQQLVIWKKIKLA